MDWNETQDFLKKLPGYIILIKKPNDNAIYGIVENSWSLGIELNRTFLYWSSDKYDPPIDGYAWATKDLISFSLKHLDWVFTIYDARNAENLPVYLNWDLWLDAHEPSTQTLSGIKNKHEARNVRFTVKGNSIDTTKKVVPLKMMVTHISI